MTTSKKIDGASFRDPSGHVFYYRGGLYRQINQEYAPHYKTLLASGLYEKLVKRGWLIPHEEVELPALKEAGVFKYIQPVRLPFISYPYEWSFTQLKEAALTTLRIQRLALRHGLTLKDASAYNLQLYRGKMTLIDTLSFEKVRPGEPWVAYRQFCQHFLAPLALMSRTDVRLQQLQSRYLDGVPLDLAARLLPFRARFNPGLLMHLFVHAKSQRYFGGKQVQVRKYQMRELALQGMIDSLYHTVSKLRWRYEQTEWGDYYTDTNYSADSRENKVTVVRSLLERVKPKTVWDLGANDGTYSQLAAEQASLTLSFDIDPVAVDKAYQTVKAAGQVNLLPLLLDVTNPTASLGWSNEERLSLQDRGPADLVMALALIHHLAISHNVPFINLARFLATLGESLIIEFVPKADSQVKRLLVSRQDIFNDYDEDSFVAAFSRYFEPVKRCPIEGSQRAIYLMKRHAAKP